jgi:fermentation-respiration switch protein FrsA (DUF1100 family)
MSKIIRVICLAAAIPASIYIGILALLYMNQRAIQYHPDPRDPSAAEFGLPDFAKVFTRTADGENLAGWWKAPPPGAALVLYFGGSGGNLSYRRDRLQDLVDAGFGVLGFDYRGFGGSSGAPSEGGLHEDARAALRYAADHAPGSPVILFGESLGTGVAVALASEVRVAGLILDSPYASVVGVAQYQYPWVPVRFLLKDSWNSESRIARVAAPVFMLHCDADEIVPAANGAFLFARAKEPKSRLVLEGCGHTDIWRGAARQKILDTIRAWTAPS